MCIILVVFNIFTPEFLLRTIQYLNLDQLSQLNVTDKDQEQIAN